MFRNFRSAENVHVLFSRLINLASIFVISLAGTDLPTSVQAAPPAQEITNMRFYLNIHYPPTLCVGREYSIRVTPLVELNGNREDGQKFNYQDRIIPGIAITAEIVNKNIATIDPAKPQSKTSGYLPESLLATSSLENQERLGDLGEVVFKLKAKKAGTTNLYLTAKVPGRWSGGRDRYFGPQGMPAGGPIKVVNCRYKVTAFTYANASYPNLQSYLTSKTVGEMKSSDGQNFSGTTWADWKAFSFSVRCSHKHTFAPAQAQLSGTLDQEQERLTVQVTFDAAPFSSTNCASSNSGELLAPGLVTTVPVSGGGRHWTYSYSWGMESMEGSASMYVTPIEDK